MVLERQNTTLLLELPKDFPTIYGNEHELTQVVFNLLRNADIHTENGTITIEAEVNGKEKEVTISVADTGAGIPSDLLPHVFEHGTSGEKGGMGFGLSICKEIIETHGKRIWIESEFGKGTTVSFTLPIFENGEWRKENPNE